jgi:hypothetical protein
VNFSQFALQQMKQEGYDFKSAAGAELLARAVANDYSNDSQAMADLVASGAAIDGPLPTTWRGPSAGSVIARIDAAFRAAISGGRMMLVRKIWEFGAVEHRPALTFDDVADDGTRKRSPVTLLLVHHSW